MSADMAIELKEYNVGVVSLWPGFVKTEYATSVFNLKDDTLIKATKMSRVFLLCEINRFLRKLLKSNFKLVKLPNLLGKLW